MPYRVRHRFSAAPLNLHHLLAQHRPAHFVGQGRENSKMFLKDNPALMSEVEEQVKNVLGMTAKPGLADTEALDD